jgi:phage tail sheath protein FI
MAAPGTSVTFVDEALPRFTTPNPSAWFVVGFAERGPVEPTAVQSLDEFVAKFGDRQTYSQLYDALDVFFREGGGEAVILRAIGPTPVKATANLLDQSGSSAPGDVALVVTAKEHGTWANGLNVEVTVSGTDFTIIVSHDTDGVLENSGTLADRAAAVTWSATSDYVTITLGASAEDPRAQGPTSLASGDDDHANATETQWLAALDLATADFGAGLVSMPGRTTDTAHANLLAHAAQFHRTAILDSIDSAVVADLIQDAEDLQDGDTDRAGGLFAPWVTCPGLTPGTTRTVPYSALQAGMIARNDATGRSVGQPAAGIFGVAQYVTGLSQEAFSESEREQLNDAGVNIGRVLNGDVRTYGNRTLVDPDDRPAWVEFSGSRVAAYIANQADAELEKHVFAVLDGRGHEIARANGAIAAICLVQYNADALYGATPEDAFFVDTGPTVNTSETLADRQLNAKLELQTSPAAERVSLTISKQPLG